MNPVAHTFCHYCGRVYPAQEWPRQCAACQRIVYRNPLPVAVVLQPVDTGLLIVRRGRGYATGQLALPGGYVEAGESWTEGAARELHEETGLEVEAGRLRACGVYSARDDSLLIFAIAPMLRFDELPGFTPTEETLERQVANGPLELVFRSHTEMMRRYFAGSLTLLEGL